MVSQHTICICYNWPVTLDFLKLKNVTFEQAKHSHGKIFERIYEAEALSYLGSHFFSSEAEVLPGLIIFCTCN